MCKVFKSAKKASIKGRVKAEREILLSIAPRMVLSSISVRFITCVIFIPKNLIVRRRRSSKTYVLKLPI